jgi:nucleoside-diphosphate-sugar epimerase
MNKLDMTTLVVGASGSTGKLLVEQLLKLGHTVKVIVRSPEKTPSSWKENNQVIMIKASVLEISGEEMAKHLSDCSAVASCLGHNLNFKGIYGKPRRLVTGAVELLCNSIRRNSPGQPVKFVLMNTTGNRNRDLNEPISFGQRVVISLLRSLLPPHPDNEKAAEYLRVKIGQNDPSIEWVAVRPDNLIDEDEVTPYSLHPSPIRNPIFNPGKTSRINVGNFMARLIDDDHLWNEWKGQMPVIYNEDSDSK